MRLSAFLTEFGQLHEKAKANTLQERERRLYEEQREEFAQALLNAQKLTLRPGETARRALRVAYAIPLEISARNVTQRSLTVELSGLGFSTLLGEIPFRVGDIVSCRLTLPGGKLLPAEAQVKNIVPQTASYRVGFELQKLSTEEHDRVMMVVFDAVLDKLRPMRGL